MSTDARVRLRREPLAVGAASPTCDGGSSLSPHSSDCAGLISAAAPCGGPCRDAWLNLPRGAASMPARRARCMPREVYAAANALGLQPTYDSAQHGQGPWAEFAGRCAGVPGLLRPWASRTRPCAMPPVRPSAMRAGMLLALPNYSMEHADIPSRLCCVINVDAPALLLRAPQAGGQFARLVNKLRAQDSGRGGTGALPESVPCRTQGPPPCHMSRARHRGLVIEHRIP